MLNNFFKACKGCEKRTLGCHATCEAYNAERKACRALKSEQAAKLDNFWGERGHRIRTSCLKASIRNR